jgi:hypothetical protein
MAVIWNQLYLDDRSHEVVVSIQCFYLYYHQRVMWQVTWLPFYLYQQCMFFAVPAWTAERILGIVKLSVMSCPSVDCSGNNWQCHLVSHHNSWHLCNSDQYKHYGLWWLTTWLHPSFPQQSTLGQAITECLASATVPWTACAHTHDHVCTWVNTHAHTHTHTHTHTHHRMNTVISV